MIAYGIFTIIFAGVCFFAGFVLSRKFHHTEKDDGRVFHKLEEVVLETLSSLSSLLNFDKAISALFNVAAQNHFYLHLFRQEGNSLTHVNSNKKIEAEALKRDLISHAIALYPRGDVEYKIVNEYYEFEPNAPVYQLQKYQFFTRRTTLARLYPIPFEYFGVRYFFVVFNNKSIINKYSNRFVQFIQRQLFLVLYLREVSSRSKDNYELLDGIFHKNPVAMCLTDSTGKTVRNNRGFTHLFPRGLDNITRLIDLPSFESVVGGSALEKDFLFENKNLKVRGTPLYSTTGNIRGCLFTLLDDSLQYLLFKKLEKSEERYKRLLKELPIGLAIINHLGNIFLVNDDFINAVGVKDPDSVKGSLLQEYFEIPYLDFSEITRKIDERSNLYFKFYLKKDYGNRVFSVHFQKIFIEEDELIEAVFQDVTLENQLYAELEQKTKLIEEELSTAKKVWEHLLSIPSLYSSLIRFETFFRPSSQLGGDFYNLIQIDEVHIGVVIADVSGHGVSASLITAMLKILIEFSPKDPHRIDDMMSYLNNSLAKILPEDQFITLFYGIIDTQNHTMEYLNCGHPFPLLYQDKTKTIELIKGSTFPLGTKRNISYSESVQKINLPINGKMLLYTDGLLTFKKGDRILRTEDLVEIFKNHIDIQNKKILNQMYLSIQKNCTQITDDDVSMLLLIINQKYEFKKTISIPSSVVEIDNAIIKIVDSIAHLISFDEDERWKVYTALYEAIINAVEHGNKFNAQKRVSVVYRIMKNFIVFKIRDEGVGFDPDKIPNPLDPANLLKPSGRGVYMIHKIMDRVKYNVSGNEVMMALRLKKERRDF